MDDCEDKDRVKEDETSDACMSGGDKKRKVRK